MASLMRARIKSKNGRHVFDILGYSLTDLIAHLEALFAEGMNWDNYGREWHIDHVRPDCSFSYTEVTDADFISCWALVNLQPIWALDNIKKGGKYART